MHLWLQYRHSLPCAMLTYVVQYTANKLKDCLLLVLVALLSQYEPLSLYEVMKAHEAHRVVVNLAGPVMACAGAGSVTVLYIIRCRKTVQAQFLYKVP